MDTENWLDLSRGERSLVTRREGVLAAHCARRFQFDLRGVPEPEAGSCPGFEDELELDELRRLAADLFPDAHLVFVDEDRLGDRAPFLGASITADVLERADQVLDAHFVSGMLTARVDVVERRADGLFLWAVCPVAFRSLEEIPAVWLHDLAYQRVITMVSDHEVAGVGLLMVRADAERTDGPLAAEDLLVRVDVDEVMEEVDMEYVALLRDAFAAADGDELAGARCGPLCRGDRRDALFPRPGTCGHILPGGFCRERLPRDWAGDVPELTWEQAHDIECGPAPGGPLMTLPLLYHDWTDAQSRAGFALHRGEPVIEPREVLRRLDWLHRPAALIDVDVDPGMAIPRYPGSRPFEPVPIRVSMAVVEHLADEEPWIDNDVHVFPSDPREALVDVVLSAADRAQALVTHGADALRGVLEAARERAEGRRRERIQDVLWRIVDVEDILREGYHHPDQGPDHGLAALARAVLGPDGAPPALADPADVVRVWRRALAPESTDEDVDRMEEALAERGRVRLGQLRGVVLHLRAAADAKLEQERRDAWPGIPGQTRYTRWELVPHLARRERFRDSVSDEVCDAMDTGTWTHELICEYEMEVESGMNDDARIAWSASIVVPDDIPELRFPMRVLEWEGIYWVFCLEYDNEGYFIRIEDAIENATGRGHELDIHGLHD